MAYFCNLGAGQQIYLDNQNGQTIVTVTMSSPGQQQQSSSRLATGTWTAPPQAFQLTSGVVIRLETSQGQHFIQIQGTSISGLSEMTSLMPSLGNAPQVPMQSVDTVPPNSMPGIQPMQPMEPMQPMQPMQMGNMQMNLKPMEMRMGNLEMRMGAPTGSSPSAQNSSTQNFCNQCGASINQDDRFCSSCGHRLKQ